MPRIPSGYTQEAVINRGERNDCTVHALAALLGIPYIEAYVKMLELGRKPKRGFHWYKVAKHFGLVETPWLHRRRVHSVVQDPSVKQGRYVVQVPRHVFAIVDGVIHDTGNPRPARIVKKVWRMPK